MSTFSRKYSLVFAAALCLSLSLARAQGEPVKYWIPFGPFGFGGGGADTASAETYGDFPSFDGQPDNRGFSFRTYSAPVSSLAGGFGWSPVGRLGALGDSLSYQSTQIGYNFKGVGECR